MTPLNTDSIRRRPDESEAPKAPDGDAQSPRLLKIVARDSLRTPEGGQRQIVEAWDGDELVGQLPVTAVSYRFGPNEGLGHLILDLIGERAVIEGH